MTPAAGRAWARSACNEQTIQSPQAYSQYRFLVVNAELVGKLVTLGMDNRRGAGGGSGGQVSVLRQMHSWLRLDRTERSTGTAVVCAVVRRRLGWGDRSAVDFGEGGGGSLFFPFGFFFFYCCS